MIRKNLNIIRIGMLSFLATASCSHASVWTTEVLQASVQHASVSCDVPEDILYAIAKVESNLWPWSIHIAGKSYYFNTKTEAVEFAADRQKKGIHHINAGLMQIYWPAHRKMFKNFDELFDPHHNVLFAAKLLQKLKTQEGSWEKAVKAYHSGIEKYGNIYGKKISKELNLPLDSM